MIETEAENTNIGMILTIFSFFEMCLSLDLSGFNIFGLELKKTYLLPDSNSLVDT